MFGSGSVRYMSSSGSDYVYHIRDEIVSVQVEFGSDLFRVLYSSPVQIGYVSSVIQASWDSVHCLAQHWIRCKSNIV